MNSTIQRFREVAAMRRLLGVLAIAVLGATTTPAMGAAPGEDDTAAQVDDLLAQQPAPQPAQPAQAAPGSRLRRALNLSEEQARRVEQILTAYRARTERQRIDLARARLDAREAMLETQPDRGKLDAIARRIGDLQGQLTRARFELTLELRSVLSPEQQARLRTLTGRMRGRR
jgi:Spy/CpxP family protein refolding chaperone